MSAEYVNIADCPKCKEQHRYRLEVKRSFVVKAFAMSDLGPLPRAVHVTRLFTCPKTGDDFQATFVLMDNSPGRIEDVSVVGEAGADEQE